MSELVMGIDLGTTNSVAGIMDSGFAVLVADGEGRRLLPSVVQYKAGGEILCGTVAKHGRAAYPERTIYSAKRFMGRRWSEVTEEEKAVEYALGADEQGAACLRIGDALVRPECVAAELLKELSKRIESYAGQAVRKAVITVPAYFNDAQRQATKLAGEQAGLEVLRILNEPTAAALAYGVDRERKKAKVAVYDLGGGTFDLSILELNEGVFQVLATNGNTMLGGDDIDRLLFNHVVGRMPDEIRESLDASSRSRLREACEAAKIRLSEQLEATLELPFLVGEYSFSCRLTQAELEEIARDVVLKTRAHCLRALQDAGLQQEDLDEVLLVGGQTRMPLVRQLVEEWFGREPNITIDPDEAVAKGAVIQAGILSGSVQNMVLLDVTPLSLGIETFGGLMNVIIPRNSTIPTKAGELFTNAVDGQKSMKIKVLQGEREMARDNWTLGEMDLCFSPGPRGSARVGVQFELDANGILHVLARDTVTGEEQVVQIRSAVDVEDEQVEQMVAESVEHAFDDMQQRRLVETQLKAKRMAELTWKALATGEKLAGSDPGMKELLSGIRSHLERMEEQLDGDHLEGLKSAMTELDEASKPLAEALMDLAMEEALKKKGLIG